MSLLRPLVLGLAACLGSSCGPRAYQEQRLLEPCLTDGSTLTIFIGVKSGTREVSRGGFSPNGPHTTTRIERADLYRADFVLTGDAATLTDTQHLLGLDGRSWDTAITTADGFLSQVPPPPENDTEIQVLAPQGNGFVVFAKSRYTVYADPTRTQVVDVGTAPDPGFLQFTWSGERLYLIAADVEGRRFRILSTVVGSQGVWEEVVYDALVTPVDADPGRTYVEAYDVLDGQPLLLLRKQYAQREGHPHPRRSTYSLLHDQRLVATWTGDPPGWIRLDLRAVVGWNYRIGVLEATLTLRSLDDGGLRSITVDARPALIHARR
jgi:hypothetical protein